MVTFNIYSTLQNETIINFANQLNEYCLDNNINFYFVIIYDKVNYESLKENNMKKYLLFDSFNNNTNSISVMILEDSISRGRVLLINDLNGIISLL